MKGLIIFPALLGSFDHHGDFLNKILRDIYDYLDYSRFDHRK
jgi:hypothetical protein